MNEASVDDAVRSNKRTAGEEWLFKIREIKGPLLQGQNCPETTAGRLPLLTQGDGPAKKEADSRRNTGTTPSLLTTENGDFSPQQYPRNFTYRAPSSTGYSRRGWVTETLRDITKSSDITPDLSTSTGNPGRRAISLSTI